MATPSIPQNLIVQTANQQVLISWDLSAGATHYKVQRSLDNVTFLDLIVVTGTPLPTEYLDTAVTLNTEYWYQVSASSDGTNYSPNTLSEWGIPVAQGENSLKSIRLAAQQRSDMVHNEFISTQEWNTYINKALYELYDMLITVYEDYFVATPIQFISNGSTFLYDMPNGSNEFLSGITLAPFTPPAFYKIMGVDLALQNANNAYVTVNKFNFIDRNRFVYPNTASTIYGVFNLQYRVIGSKIMFIPTPSASQSIRIWYFPRLTELLKNTDSTSFAISGWDEYVIVRAAKYALDKEESDSTKLDQELIFLKDRIESSASNRDAGQPDKISDTRANNGWGSGNGGWNGGQGGF